jgi:hypothetical protein
MREFTDREKLQQRWGQLKTERASWWSHWKELSQNLQPFMGRFFVQDRNKGTRRHNTIYDNTGLRCVQILGAGMMGGMTSPARPWFRLTTPDKDLAKAASVKLWLSQVTTLMLDVFAKSNTYRALHSGYQELGVFGTSAKVVLPDFKNVIHHTPLTCGEYAIGTNYRGEVDTLYREFDKTVYDLVSEFGYDRCSVAVRNLYDRGSLDSWITIMHAIEPNTAREPGKRDAANMAWRSVYWEPAAPPDQFLRASGFKTFPALVSRWDLSGGDVYGNSPGMTALGDVKQLQQEQLRKSQGIDFMTKPPLQAPTSMKNREVQMLPGGVTYVDAVGSQNAIQSIYDVRLDLSHLLADIQDVRDRVRSAFYADLFLMLDNNTNPNMTATEVAERHEEKLMMLGPTVERLHNEELQPLVEATFQRILEAGLLPPPPPEMHGQDLNVEFVSMLAQAQRAVATNSVDRFVGNLGAIAQMKPNVLDKFDEDEWAEQYSDMLGVDPALIVSDDKVALIRKARAQAQQQQEQAAAANQAADTAQKLGNTPVDSSSAAGALLNPANPLGNLGRAYTTPLQTQGSPIAPFSGYN